MNRKQAISLKQVKTKRQLLLSVKFIHIGYVLFIPREVEPYMQKDIYLYPTMNG